SPETVKKHEYASAHFARLNERLGKVRRPARYQFNMVSPKDYGKFFTELRKRKLVGFRSALDVAMVKVQSGE
ncbi:MAG: hypothetical protein KGS61_11150, partial [Verrucomicrobia bacterium]|nr:hypothetical protein [Verrucomicrobiota bacterium]